MSSQDHGLSLRNQGAVEALSGFSAENLAAASQAAERIARARTVCDMARRRDTLDVAVWSETFEALRARYGAATQPEIMKACRKIREKLGFIDSWLSLKQGYVMEGFRLGGAGGRELIDKVPSAPWNRLADDLAKEYFTVSNAVVTWLTDDVMQVDGQRAPRVAIVQDTEDIEFDDPGGIEKVRPNSSRRIDKELVRQLNAMIERRDAAQQWDGWIRLGTEQETAYGERFVIASTAKRGAGYGRPSLFPLFFDLSLLETLRLGDMNGALSMRDVMRHITVGHEIAYGPMAGQPTWFLKKTQATAIAQALEKKLGSHDFISRHDLNVTFPHLDPEFFSEKKYDPVWQRILEWAGPLFRALNVGAGEAGVIAMQAWRAEGNRHRAWIKRALEAVLNDPDYHRGAVTTGNRVEVYFSPLSFLSHKEGREMLSFGIGNGLVSPQTATEMLGFELDYERERMAAAQADPESWRPVFEPKQGLLQPDGNQGGRPPGVAGE